MGSAPWDAVPAQDAVFVLVTGANSGVGLGICERLIDEFLATRSLTAHLVLLPTTRSCSKSAETVALLRKHLVRAASSKTIVARGATDPQDTIRRVHISSVQLDLCDLSTVQRAADQLVHGKVFFEGLGDLKLPRLDAVILNAGIGGWTHISWFGFVWDIITRGWVQATTRPRFKRSTPGLTVAPLPGLQETLGLVFCANVFGHYLFGHYIAPLLNRSTSLSGQIGDSTALPSGRIIWQSSVDPSFSHFSLDDIQCLRTPAAYESSKMLTDVLCLTAGLPSAAPYSSRYLASTSPATTAETAKPKIYLAHPGVVATTMFPLHFTLMWAYVLGTTLSRWLGSPWHPVIPYKAAFATVWLALATQSELDAEKAERCKWGSCTDFWGNCMAKKTEIEMWGWDGKAVSPSGMSQEDVGLIRVLKKSVGRRPGATMPTEETITWFEETGAKCWANMENLRAEWDTKISASKS